MAKNNNLQDFVTDIADAIREKKGTEDKINPQDFADEIRDIHEEVDMLGFSKIGYTDENASALKEMIDYSYELAKGWDGSFNMLKAFVSAKKGLPIVPKVDISAFSNLDGLFNNCAKTILFPTFDYTNVKSIRSTFFGVYADKIALKNTHNIKNYDSAFSQALFSKIDGLDLSSATSTSNMFGSIYLTHCTIKNIGKSTLTTYTFNGATNWGTDGEESRQSLIDSLITYSYDRASAGMATATIQLSANTKALLTDEEIAQITAKGFTIA